MMGYGMGWGLGWLGMILFWLVPLVLVLVGVRFLMADGGRRGDGAASDAPPSSRALATLQERYAKGEINREEFLQKRDDILGN